MMGRVKGAGLNEAALKAVARGYYKLLAVKDEWEVARLYSKPEFKAALKDSFEGDLKITFHVGAWPFGKTDKVTGKQVKGEAGEWMLTAFGLMNRFRGLRGTLLDPFRNSAEARLARQVLADYESDIEFALTHARLAEASKISELLNLPDHIRGYGHVRERHVAEVTQTRQKLRDTITSSASKAA
jgi:indolepyruvate ferredoxin oxidoreductase